MRDHDQDDSISLMRAVLSQAQDGEGQQEPTVRFTVVTPRFEVKILVRGRHCRCACGQSGVGR
jgi:hypothetical protein